MSLLRAVAGAAAGLAAAAAVHAGAEVASRRLDAERPLLAAPDDRGAFSEIVLHSEPVLFDAVAPTYRDLLRALAPDVRVTVAVENAAAADRFRAAFAADLAPGRLRFVEVGKKITTWSRDRYTLVHGPLGEPILLVPPRVGAAAPARANDWEVPFRLAEAAGAEVRIAPFIFDGGDLLVTEERVYATAALLEKNLGPEIPDRAALEALLERTLGRKALVLGDHADEVPDHHICMILTPLPDGRVAVGDVRAARPWAEKLAIAAADTSEDMIRRFDGVAAALEQAGVGVVRVPLIPYRGERSYVTYHNGVIERRGGETVFYMPTYGLKELDELAANMFERAGMRVRPIASQGIFRKNGSVRCLVNVLARGDARDNWDPAAR